MATQLQQMIHELQLNPEFQDAEALQRIAQTLQTDLYTWEQRPRAHIPPPVILTPAQRDTWRVFLVFHQLLLDYAGWVNRDQWLHLVDVTADLLSRGPQGDTPYISDHGTWMIGDVDTGVYASGQPPVIGPNGNWFVDNVDTGFTALGKDGLPGPPGAQGPQGIPGQGLIVLGQFNTAGDLTTAHPTGNVGDAYLVGVTDPKHLFIWFDSAWHDVGPLTGVGINEAPNTGLEYVRNGSTQSWIEVSHNGGTFP